MIHLEKQPCIALIGSVFCCCNFLYLTVTILVGAGISGIVCVSHDIPILQIGPILAHIIISGLAGNILNAASVEIYPTSMR